MWQIHFTRQVQRDAKKIAAADLKNEVQDLLAVLQENPFQHPPPYEKFVGDLAGAYSRRISYQHRLVYQVYIEEKAVKVLRMWTHYE